MPSTSPRSALVAGLVLLTLRYKKVQEKQLLRGLKATGFLFLLGRACSQHLALYRSLLISRILH